MTHNRPTLSPEMLLFEIAAMCSRAGLAVSSANPAASRHYAEQLLRSLGLTVTTPALPAAPVVSVVDEPTTTLPVVPTPWRPPMFRDRTQRLEVVR